MDQLTTGHPRRQEFIARLERRLDFRERGDQPNDYQWPASRACLTAHAGSHSRRAARTSQL
jgi:hypothetical protein